MTDPRKQKLIALGPDALAGALLKLAVYSSGADDLIEQLIATPKENIQRFKKKLSAIKRRRRFVDWRGAAGFARELEMLLQDLKSGVDDPLTGAELVAAFYEADSAIFAMCDDSSGNVGDVFRFVKTAYSWLKRIPEAETHQAYERDKLLEEIYQKQGDSEKLTELLYRKFKSYHSADTLEALLDVIGHDKRNEVINNEVPQILKNERLLKSDAEFLIAVGKIDEAEAYILERSDQLDGNYYTSLLSLAGAMEAENRYLVTSLIYRSLLVSVLERGYTKAYPHGIRYLKKLDRFAANVEDWKKFHSHTAFKEQIIEAHGRKRSFWSKYEVK